ncbi:helicase HerA-like domain-containing protein [Xanthomonas campestris pv. campestris]
MLPRDDLLHLGQEDLPARLLALAQALSVTERQLHGSPLNIRRVVSRICGALFRGSLADNERAQVRAASPVGTRYDTAINRESAAELLARRVEQVAEQTNAPPARTREEDDAQDSGFGQAIKDAVFGTKRRQGMLEAMAKQTSRTVGNKIGQQIVRGIFGSIFGGKR